MMFDERTDGIEHAVEVITDWLQGDENPLTWNPPTYAPLWRWCLARNLRDAACAQRAWDLSSEHARWMDSYFEGYYDQDDEPPWSPGCGVTPEDHEEERMAAYLAKGTPDDEIDEPLGCCPRNTWGDEFHDPGCDGVKPGCGKAWEGR